MSNWLDYVLDVLANNPDEINQIAGRLRWPSPELVTGISKESQLSENEGTEFLSKLLDFETVKNLGYLDPSVNQARRFRLSFKDRFAGIVDGHLAEVSESFPDAIFLLEYYDVQYSYSGKMVIRAGEAVHRIFDGCQKAQNADWTLLDIFAPFRAEYYSELPFGSLWTRWLEDMEAAVQELKCDSRTPTSPVETPGTSTAQEKQM